ncbi:MAG: hypothetical protein LKJ83_10445 [Eubacteriaceae bacterium]|jgi:uncharacterized alkaline shock family protein YloU|nr:hypothetical protein [Eubacteriaceae bacterium]
MKVYALVGKSGTGKSYQAMNLCSQRGIESIIDDGLFVYNNTVQAGTSAKRQDTKIGAIKTALFMDEKERSAVAKAIRRCKPESILVLGTSKEMADRIRRAIELPPIDEFINIEDITTESERKIAYKQRVGEGKHVVPVPTFQLKRQFSGYFVNPMTYFKGMGFGAGSYKNQERSVVRPTYSYLGDFIISDRVITDIVEHVASGIDGVETVYHVITEKKMDELRLTITAQFRYGVSAVIAGRGLQKQCKLEIEKMTAFNIGSIDVEVKDLTWAKNTVSQ